MILMSLHLVMAIGIVIEEKNTIYHNFEYTFVMKSLYLFILVTGFQ